MQIPRPSLGIAERRLSSGASLAVKKCKQGPLGMSVNFETGEVVNVEAGGWAKRQGIVPGLDCIAGFVTDDSQSLILFTADGIDSEEQHVKHQLLSDRGPRPITVCFKRAAAVVAAEGTKSPSRRSSFEEISLKIGELKRISLGHLLKKKQLAENQSQKAAVPFVPQYKTLCVYENHKRRFKKKQGWAPSDEHPLWGDAGGKAKEKTDINRMCRLPVKGQTRGWQWQGDWAISTDSPHLKKGGWAYARTWEQLHSQPERPWKDVFDKVRRRKWSRTMQSVQYNPDSLETTTVPMVSPDQEGLHSQQCQMMETRFKHSRSVTDVLGAKGLTYDPNEDARQEMVEREVALAKIAQDTFEIQAMMTSLQGLAAEEQADDIAKVDETVASANALSMQGLNHINDAERYQKRGCYIS